MEWLIWIGLAALLAGCFAAGTLPGDHWMELVRGWDKVRYAVYRRDRFLAVMGVIGTILTQTFSGMFRLLTFGMGAGMILTERAGEKLGDWFPGYPKPKEIESGVTTDSDSDGKPQV